MKKAAALIVVLMMLMVTMIPALADEDPAFSYRLMLTDQDGRTVTDPRSLSAGDILRVEIELTRTDITESSYDYFGMEFRVLTRGLEYNNDGSCLRADTVVRKLSYMDGDTVGFAWYDMEQIGGPVGNPVLACSWSYTVSDPSAVNLTVPVALVYVTGHRDDYIPVGNARLILDPNGGKINGEDVSGEYPSGTTVTLPGAVLGDTVFEGWSDGFTVYPAGAQYTVSGVVTLTAQWQKLDRSRHVSLDPNGGSIDGEDPSGWYADGEVLILPDAVREGFIFRGWSDGVSIYDAGNEYTVYNTVIITAQWEPIEIEEPTDEHANDNRSPLVAWFLNDDGTLDGSKVTGTGIGGLGLLGLLIFLILWKRCWVLYSLKTGDVALSYKDKEHNVQVEVILFAEDENGNKVEYHLNKSEVIEAKHRLRFIHGQMETYPIVPVEKGKYKGKLIITDGAFRDEKKCRIKVLDREIRERENR